MIRRYIYVSILEDELTGRVPGDSLCWRCERGLPHHEFCICGMSPCPSMIVRNFSLDESILHQSHILRRGLDVARAMICCGNRQSPPTNMHEITYSDFRVRNRILCHPLPFYAVINGQVKHSDHSCSLAWVECLFRAWECTRASL